MSAWELRVFGARALDVRLSVGRAKAGFRVLAAGSRSYTYFQGVHNYITEKWAGGPPDYKSSWGGNRSGRAQGMRVDREMTKFVRGVRNECAKTEGVRIHEAVDRVMTTGCRGFSRLAMCLLVHLRKKSMFPVGAQVCVASPARRMATAADVICIDLSTPSTPVIRILEIKVGYWSYKDKYVRLMPSGAPNSAHNRHLAQAKLTLEAFRYTFPMCRTATDAAVVYIENEGDEPGKVHFCPLSLRE